MASPPVPFCFWKYLSREPGTDDMPARRWAGPVLLVSIRSMPRALQCPRGSSRRCRRARNSPSGSWRDIADDNPREVERRRVADLGGDRSVAFGPERLGVGGFRSLRGGALRRIERVDRGTILCADVV